MSEGAALGLVLDQVSKDKNIDRTVLVEALEQAILTAAKRASACSGRWRPSSTRRPAASICSRSSSSSSR